MFPNKMPGEDFINSWYPILIALSIGLVVGIRNYFKGRASPSQDKATGKVVIVTGANSGMGKETAKEMASRGARVILACRDEEKAKTAVAEIIEATGNKNVTSMKLDLASFKSIRDFVKEFEEKEDKLDILINNAGLMCHPEARTDDGHEIHMQTNFYGPMLLTHLLLDELKQSAPSRIVNVTAFAYQIANIQLNDFDFKSRTGYKPGDAYADSKLAMVFYSKDLAKQLEGTNVTVNTVNPGIVDTPLFRHMPLQKSFFVRTAFAPFKWFFFKGAKDGCQCAVHCAVAKEEEGVTGKFYNECMIKDFDKVVDNDDLAKKVVAKGYEILKIKPHSE